MTKVRLWYVNCDGCKNNVVCKFYKEMPDFRETIEKFFEKNKDAPLEIRLECDRFRHN